MTNEQILNGYRSVQPIGKATYLAQQLTLDRSVVVKEVGASHHVFPHLALPEVLTHIQIEVRKAARLSHPNIISIIEADISRVPAYVVYEHVEGKSLRQALEQGPLPPDRATQLLLQVLHALRSAHRKEVFHGGLGPECVMIDAMGNARIGDFGLGALHSLGARDPLHVDTGSLAYVAPEALGQSFSATAQGDLFAVGILFYEALSGLIPGRRARPPTALHSELSPSFDEIFNRLTLDDPTRRYQSVDQVLEDCDYSDVKIQGMRGTQACFFFDRGDGAPASVEV